MEDQELKIQAWGEFLAKSAQARFLKKRAVVSENFAEAGRLKKEEAALQQQLIEAENLALARSEATSAADRKSKEKDVATERANLEALKRKAVEAEDFAEAGRLKKRLKLLEEGGAAAAGASGPGNNNNNNNSIGEGEVVKRAWEAALDWIQAAIINPGEAKNIKDELLKSAPSGMFEVQSVAAAAAASKGSAAKTSAKPMVIEKLAASPSPVPEVALVAFLGMTKEELWQKAWEVAWKKADILGEAGNEAQVKASAQKLWKGWLQEQSKALKQKPAAPSMAAKAKTLASAKDAAVPARATNATTTSSTGKLPSSTPTSKVEHYCGSSSSTSLTSVQASPAGTAAAAGGSTVPGQEWRKAQERNWRGTAEADWHRAKAESEKRMASFGGVVVGGEYSSSSGRDLCAILKARCPADQPLPFERLLAVCPNKTMVKQLIQAMAKEPQEFRQNVEGSEFCVRPVNSRCADWLPVNSSTVPRGFKENGCLPESMLSKARLIFEEKMKPLGQAAEDPLTIFLTQPGRLPADSPIHFTELISRCPPGTTVVELVRVMAKKRDLFRQDSTGKMFCVRPRVKCKDWGAVNPYADPTAVKAAPGPSSMMGCGAGGSGIVVGGPMVSGEDGGGED